ncbi:MAG: hypothetical protein CL963_03500 [Euryarchaeota archaeon]|jgi:hypothetical protein|nr:hypothetical protein [Euryarchaeota archaeon]MAF89543.1 hypothetical protein [Euryarchaeota archaeon]|tara:strand:- start:11074 stop:12180 length:1107 start_codon:yes stop_codon:yes gene_type:complete
MSENEPVEIKLDDSMAETLKEIQSRDDSEEIEEEVVEVVEEKHPRGEDGKFVEKDKTEAGSEEPDIMPTQESGEATALAESEPASDHVNPPSTWTAESKSKWADVPDWVRTEVHKRENESIKGVDMMRDRATFGDRMNQVVQPYMPLINSQGGTPESTVQGMLNTAYQLYQGTPQAKTQLIVKLAHEHGFLNELVAYVMQDGQTRQQNSQIRSVIVPLQNQIQTLEQKLNGQNAASQQAQQSETMAELEAFAAETNEDGTLAHPYFENVRERMAQEFESGAQTFKEAYDNAVWSNPDTRKLMQSQQVSSTEKTRQEQATERAKKAKKADSVNISTKGTHESGQQADPIGTVEDTMKATMENINARDNG